MFHGLSLSGKVGDTVKFILLKRFKESVVPFPASKYGGVSLDNVHAYHKSSIVKKVP